MSPRTPNKTNKSNDDALAAFVSKKTEIDAMLTRLQALSDDHFGYSPDDIGWDHVGTGYYAKLLKRVTGSACFPDATKAPGHASPFNEGEHAA